MAANDLPAVAPRADLWDALLQGLDPQHLSDLDMMLGTGAPPALDTRREQAPRQSAGQRVLQAFAGTENQPQPAPQSFAQGLIQGGMHGVGLAASRAQAARAKLEAQIADRQRLRDEANSKATADYRAAQYAGRREIAGKVAAAVVDQAKEKTPAQIEAEATARARGERTGNPPKTLADIRAESAARAQGTASAARVPTSGPVADDAFKEQALLYVRTGKIPSFGMGSQGASDRAAFRQYVHENYPGIDIAKNAAQYKADQSSFQNQQKNYDQIGVGAGTLANNIQTLRGTMNEVPDTGITGANGLVRGVAQFFGNAAVPQFSGALHVVQNEAGRILGGNFSGGGQLYDSEKKDLKAVASGSATRKQLAGVLDIIEADKLGRLNAGRKKLNEIKSRLDWAESGAQSPNDTNWYGNAVPTRGGFIVTDPNGQPQHFATRGQANDFIEKVNSAHGY